MSLWLVAVSQFALNVQWFNEGGDEGNYKWQRFLNNPSMNVFQIICAAKEKHTGNYHTGSVGCPTQGCHPAAIVQHQTGQAIILHPAVGEPPHRGVSAFSIVLLLSPSIMVLPSFSSPGMPPFSIVKMPTLSIIGCHHSPL